MTDPIRIPIDGSHGAQDAWQHTLTITPDLARQIVALAKIRPDKLDQEWRDPNGPMPVPAPPVADDDAAATAMSRAYASQMPEGFRPAPNGIRCVLAAIKGGKIPGVCCDNDPNALPRRIAQECADALGKLKQARADLAAETDAKHRALTCAADYAERAESNNREINRLANIVANDGDRIAALTAQRDRLAEAKRDAEMVKAERNRLHVDLRREWQGKLQSALAERDQTIGLLAEAAEAIRTRVNPYLVGGTSTGKPPAMVDLLGRIDALIARISKPEAGKGEAP